MSAWKFVAGIVLLAVGILVLLVCSSTVFQQYIWDLFFETTEGVTGYGNSLVSLLSP